MQLSRGRRFLATPARYGFALYLLVLAGAFASIGERAKACLVLALVPAAVIAGALIPIHGSDARGRVGHWLPAIVPGALAWVLAREPRFVELLVPDSQRREHAAIVALAVAVVVGALILGGVDVRAAVHRGVHAITSAIGTAVSMVVFILVLLPLGIGRLWRAADPMRTGAPAREATTAWHTIAPQPPRLATRTYRADPKGGADRPDRPFVIGCRVIGAVVLVLLVDLAVGVAWSYIAPPTSAAGSPTATIDGRALSVAPQDLDAPGLPELPDDPREDAPALQNAPWRHEYFQALQRMPTTYWPYVLWRPLPVVSAHINLTNDWERVSYRSPEVRGAELPDIDIYGGNAAFGEGQRDEHTIASELVRLAEADGIPIRVHNRGVRGWVNWQAMLLFEERSSDPSTRPDVAIFYDGANELEAQREQFRGAPSYTEFEGLGSGGAAAGSDGSAPVAPSAPVGLWANLRAVAGGYPNWSATFRAARAARTILAGAPAAASPSRQRSSADSEGAAAATLVYRQGQALIQDIAERDGVDVLFFWQPMRDGGWDGYGDGLEAPTVDLTHALDRAGDVYIDDANVNEAGAAAAAEAIWADLQINVRAWYAER